LADQDPSPPPFDPSKAQCSAPFFLRWVLRPFKKYCVRHDERYHYGGTWEEKLDADAELYWSIYNDGWYGRRLAKVVYGHIRFYSFNYPPDHPARSARQISKVRAWNWEGPGMPAAKEILTAP